MPTHPIPAQVRADAPALAGCFEVIFASLLHHINAAWNPLGRFAIPAWNRISRTRQRLARLLALLAAGRLPRTRAQAPHPDTRKRKGGPPAPYLPHRRGWLGHVAGYQLRSIASQLNHLLHLPQTQATLAAAPPQARAAIARTLKTACRLLDIPLPEPLNATLPAPKPRRSRAKPPKPPEPPAPPLRPLPAYVRAAVRAWKPKYG